MQREGLQEVLQHTDKNKHPIDAEIIVISH